METQTDILELSHAKHAKRGRIGCPAGPETPQPNMQNMQNQVRGDYCIFCRRVFSYFLYACLGSYTFSAIRSSSVVLPTFTAR
jgi:hypothetical protein